MPTNMRSEDTIKKTLNGAATSPRMSWCANTEPNGVPCLSNINLHDYPATGTWIPHPSLYGYLRFPRLDAKSIIWTSK